LSPAFNHRSYLRGTVEYCELATLTRREDARKVLRLPLVGMPGPVHADDDVLVAGHGVVLRGPTDIARYHDVRLAASLKQSRLTVEITSVRFSNRMSF
jgi:hypothetical protein